MIPAENYRTTDTPDKPGVYMFRDRFGDVIYVGKAKSLRKRLASYFQPSRKATADPKLRSLINSIVYYELYCVRTDQESLLLESRLIKQHCPRYNIVLRDDKRFLLVKIDPRTPFPRLILARLRKDDGCLYFGPFPLAGALRATVDFLTRHFGLRSCRPRVPGEEDFKHCLDHVVRDCTAPCVGRINAEEYGVRVAALIEVLDGNTVEIIAELTDEMTRHADKRRFERAARLRDVIENIRTVFGGRHRTFERSNVVRYPGQEGVDALKQALELKTAPQCIECFDISNIHGSSAVGSMVCFRSGAPSKKDYRHYRIKTVTGIDDFAMIGEAVSRRYRRVLADDKPLPDLVVIDGGIGQLHAAFTQLSALGLSTLPVIGLAKRQEEIFSIGRDAPLSLERHDAALRLLQAIRDEAHRFALSFHRDLRRKRILNSLLDEIPGIGDVRKQQILKAFGSVRNLRRHSPEVIAERVPGIGAKMAAEIARSLARSSG